jgi:hypothetical protein
MKAATMGKLLGAMKASEGGRHGLDVLPEPCTLSRLSVYFVHSLSFSEQLFL